MADDEIVMSSDEIANMAYSVLLNNLNTYMSLEDGAEFAIEAPVVLRDPATPFMLFKAVQAMAAIASMAITTIIDDLRAQATTSLEVPKIDLGPEAMRQFLDEPKDKP